MIQRLFSLLLMAGLLQIGLLLALSETHFPLLWTPGFTLAVSLLAYRECGTVPTVSSLLVLDLMLLLCQPFSRCGCGQGVLTAC